MRAAIAETEDLDRVVFVVDEQLAVAGHTVTDLTHLLAELTENAVRFSPPDTAVTHPGPHRTRSEPGGELLTVEDWGVGMPPAELAAANELLAEPPEIDLSVSQRLGFHVVARLAARHGIRVSLSSTPGSGITAVIVAAGGAVRQGARSRRERRPQPAAARSARAHAGHVGLVGRSRVAHDGGARAQLAVDGAAAAAEPAARARARVRRSGRCRRRWVAARAGRAGGIPRSTAPPTARPGSADPSTAMPPRRPDSAGRATASTSSMPGNGPSDARHSGNGHAGRGPAGTQRARERPVRAGRRRAARRRSARRVGNGGAGNGAGRAPAPAVGQRRSGNGGSRNGGPGSGHRPGVGTTRPGLTPPQGGAGRAADQFGIPARRPRPEMAPRPAPSAAGGPPNGLRRRVPQANLAPELRDKQSTGPEPAAPAPGNAAAAASALSRYQASREAAQAAVGDEPAGYEGRSGA